MRTVTAEQVAQAVGECIPRIASELRPDMLSALKDARGRATGERECFVLDQLLENAVVAARDHVPLCQDTGTVWVALELGPDVAACGSVFSLVDTAVAEAYEKHALRMSVLRDALCKRENTENNTPAFCEILPSETPGARLHVMLKGGGSDNASRVCMLAPGAGREGIEEAVLSCVREKAANACPPLVLGIGIGATFDKVGSLAKKALLRPIGSPAKDAEVAAFEKRLLEAVNATGIGPGALGGATTAVAVHVNTAPCHIAALPLAVNMGCSAMRSACVELEVGA